MQVFSFVSSLQVKQITKAPLMDTLQRACTVHAVMHYYVDALLGKFLHKWHVFLFWGILQSIKGQYLLPVLVTSCIFLFLAFFLQLYTQLLLIPFKQVLQLPCAHHVLYIECVWYTLKVLTRLDVTCSQVDRLDFETIQPHQSFVNYHHNVDTCILFISG